MTVKDLIEQLQSYDPDDLVILTVEGEPDEFWTRHAQDTFYDLDKKRVCVTTEEK